MLLRTRPDDAVLVIVVHHIASDAWSTGILMQDLGVDTSKSQEVASPSRARFAPAVQ